MCRVSMFNSIGWRTQPTLLSWQDEPGKRARQESRGTRRNTSQQTQSCSALTINVNSVDERDKCAIKVEENRRHTPQQKS